MSGGIHTVLFDYGGVIAEEGFHDGLMAIAIMSGCDGEEFYQHVRRLIADCGYLTGRAQESFFWEQVRRRYALRPTDGQLRGEILQRFVLRPAMLDSVERLRGAGIRAGIISDQTNWLDELDRRDGLFSRFDIVFNSYHAHASKYHGDLFPYAARQLKSAPGQVLIVDDNAGNIEKARQHGFGGILFESEQQFRRELEKLFPGIFN